MRIFYRELCKFRIIAGNRFIKNQWSYFWAILPAVSGTGMKANYDRKFLLKSAKTPFPGDAG
jgi:hypothetical protein